jgi:chromosome segregation ATPase
MAEEGQQQQDDKGGNSGGQQGGGDGGGGEKTFSQAQLNAILAQNRREVESKFEGYDDLKSKAEQFDALTESAKSELERATGQANEFKSKWEAEQGTRSQLEKQLLRQQVSAKQHLDPDLWDRVRGDTKEEIEADVKALVEKFGTTGGNQRPPRGLGSGAGAPDVATKKERAAAAVRGMAR